MQARVCAWIQEQLDAAETGKRCVVAHGRTERDRMRKAVEAHMAIEILPLVFARPTYWQDLKPRARMHHKMHALQQLYPDLVFAGPSAAVAYGLAVSNRFLDKVWVRTDRKAHRRQSAYLRPVMVSHGATERRQGLLVTALARTVGDCLRLMDFRAGLAIADSALRMQGLTPQALGEKMRRDCWHMSGLARALEVLALADGRAESGGESIARATMLELGMAAPDLQRGYTSPIDPVVTYRADFVWSVAGGDIVGELDGLEKYESEELRGGRTIAQVIGDEHRRQSHIEACQGVLRMVRFGFSDVMREAAFLQLLEGCGVPRSYALDERVVRAGGVLRCR